MNVQSPIKIKVPASTSNLGPGFDTLGLALNRYLSVEVCPAERLTVSVEGEGKEHIAVDESNLVHRGMLACAERSGKTLPPVCLHLRNGIPACGGLGGSGAAIAGGIFLANELLKTNLSRQEMLSIAVAVEGHPDNVSAALMGGLTINCFDDGAIRCRSVKVTRPLSIVTCSPQFQVLTKQARQILPENIPLADAVRNIENVSALVAAFMSGEFEDLRYSTADRLHERYRAALIPGYDDVKAAALSAGALSLNISGAGPTLFCFTLGNERQIGTAMVEAFDRNGKRAVYDILKVENSGAAVV